MAFTGFRAPALPIPGGIYEQRQQAELIRALRLYFNILDSLTPQQAQSFSAEEFIGGSFAGGNISGATISGFGSKLEMPHALLMSNQNQSNAGTTSENLVTYNVNVFSEGVSVVDSSKLYFSFPGQYLITARFQIQNTGNSPSPSSDFDVWLKQTGVNYPLSNTRFSIPVRKSAGVPTYVSVNISGIFSVTTGAEYLELAWWADSTDVSLIAGPTLSNPTRPAAASVIVTVNFLAALPNRFRSPNTVVLSISSAAPTIGVTVPPAASTLSIVGSAPTITIA